MNLQLHHVISDITGVTGMAMLDAILGGERDPQKLSTLRHPRIKAAEETIAEALVGDYRPEHLFTLRQSLKAYRQYQLLITDCDAEIEKLLEPSILTSFRMRRQKSRRIVTDHGEMK